MERTLGLIQRAHDGDKEARDILVEENVGCLEYRPAVSAQRRGAGGSVPDRNDRAD